MSADAARGKLMSRNGINRAAVGGGATPLDSPRYRLPTTSGHASSWLLERAEAAAKQEQQGFVDSFKKVDERRAAIGRWCGGRSVFRFSTNHSGRKRVPGSRLHARSARAGLDSCAIARRATTFW